MVQDEDSGARGLSLADYLTVVRSYWVGVTAIMAVAVACGLAWYAVQPRIYAAESSGIVAATGAENLSLSVAGDSLAKSKAKAYKSVAESTLVADRVVKSLGLSESPQAAAASVTIDVPTDATVMSVTAKSTDPAQAKAIADGWVEALAAQVSDLEKVDSPGGTPAIKVVPFANATLPTSPVSPRLDVALLVAALGGLLLGLGYAFVRSRLDRKVRRAAAIEGSFHLPVIGSLPHDKRLSGTTQILDDASGAAGGPSHAMGEALRELRTNLQFMDVDRPPRVLLITSSMPAEGKSTVICNLAATIAAAGEDVIVVDGDLRRPSVHSVFGTVAEVGVTDILTGRASIDDLLQPWPALPHLKVLSAGRVPPNPSELLGSRAMHQLVAELSSRAVVLIDAPPVLPVTDAAVLSRVADGTLVVARVGKTTTDNLHRSLRNLARVRGRVLGVILNCVATKGEGRDSYGYYTAYASEDRHEPDSERGSRTTVPAPLPALSSPGDDPGEGSREAPRVALAAVDGGGGFLRRGEGRRRRREDE